MEEHVDAISPVSPVKRAKRWQMPMVLPLTWPGTVVPDQFSKMIYDNNRHVSAAVFQNTLRNRAEHQKGYRDNLYRALWNVHRSTNFFTWPVELIHRT